MSTNERPREKRIADELSVLDEMVPESPPVHPEHLLNDCGVAETHEGPPQTRLLLEGVEHEAITADFLVEVHDLADEIGLSLESISVGSSE